MADREIRLRLTEDEVGWLRQEMRYAQQDMDPACHCYRCGGASTCRKVLAALDGDGSNGGRDGSR